MFLLKGWPLTPRGTVPGFSIASGGDSCRGRSCLGGQGSVFSQGYPSFTLRGINSHTSYASGGALWIQHSCRPPRPWREPPFACYFPAMERYQRLPGFLRGALCPAGCFFPLPRFVPSQPFSTFVRAKVAKPAGETPGPPLRRTRMGLVAPHAPDRVWRLRVAPPGKEPSANAAKSMGKQPVWRHLSPAGIPSGHPPSKAVLGDRLGRRRLSAVD